MLEYKIPNQRIQLPLLNMDVLPLASKSLKLNRQTKDKQQNHLKPFETQRCSTLINDVT